MHPAPPQHAKPSQKPAVVRRNSTTRVEKEHDKRKKLQSSKNNQTTNQRVRKDSGVQLETGGFSHEEAVALRHAELSSITCLADAFDTFDFNHDDRLDLREQIVMYHEIIGSFRKSMATAIKSGQYQEAIHLRETQKSLKKEFQSMQQETAIVLTRDEEKKFQTAKAVALQQNNEEWDRRFCEMETQQAALDFDLQRKQQIERDNLEKKIAATPEPLIKFSKKLLELIQAEKSLTQLKQFEMAIAARKQSKALEMIERKKHHRRIKLAKQKLVSDLLETQSKENAKR